MNVPTPEQFDQYQREGYFIQRGVLTRDAAMEIRGVIRNHILSPDNEATGDQYDPMDPMGDAPEARAARFRKLGNFCVQSPIIWHHAHCGEPLLRIARHFVGDDILLKFNSCFLKPAKTGSATPWHQDNGLWRDGDSESFNFWMAIDPATRANGCLQFIPGSHREPIETHVLYEDSIHGELLRPRVKEMIERHGLHHIELEPGDTVFWHSNLYHYSPPNTSPDSRIAIAGVYSSPEVATRGERFKQYHRCMTGGGVCTAFPPAVHTAPGEAVPAGPYPKAEAVYA